MQWFAFVDRCPGTVTLRIEKIAHVSRFSSSGVSGCNRKETSESCPESSSPFALDPLAVGPNVYTSEDG